MITIIQNTNTLLRVARVTDEKEEGVGELYFEYIVGWQVETEPHFTTQEMQSFAIPVTSSGETFSPDCNHAIVNKFTEEWDIPYDCDGKGFEKLLKRLLQHRDRQLQRQKEQL